MFPISVSPPTRVEAGSNTSTVTLRIVGGNEKGRLKSETVKYDREYQGTRTRGRLRWQGPVAYTKGRPVLSSERTPHKKQNRNSNSNKYLAMSPKWGSTLKFTDWLTVSRNASLTLTVSRVNPCGCGVEYLHRDPASRSRRRKWDPVLGGITRLPSSWGT
jgi:hypothetical protein